MVDPSKASIPNISSSLPIGDSILRALAATTPQLPQIQLPEAGQSTTSETPLSPSKLPEHRYKLEGEIARGGMGAVLRGRDEDLGREIAVKVMLQNHAGKTELLQRFVEEAQIAGQLQHPGITPVYELGQFPDQRPYFTMKLIRGQTLAKLLKERSDPSCERSRFLKIFEQVCQTMAYAHARKVIHRDLKPQNIMVGAFGEVQVMDWGLAKVLLSSAERNKESVHRPEIRASSEGSVQTKRSSGNSTDIPNTQAGSVLGTPAYMAPEQARAEVDQLDECADVFGLGAILCEILTGKPPYVGENGLEIYRQAVDADLAEAYHRLQTCGADDELITLAKCCLSVNRDDRPRDGSELTKELTGYLLSVEERLKQAELTAVKATTKAEEESKRRRVTFRLAAGILLTLLAGLAGSLWQMRRAMDAEESARNNESTAKKERDEKEVQRNKAEQRLHQVEKGTALFAELLNGINPRSEVKGGPPLYQQLLARAEQAADQLQPELIADPLVIARLQVLLGNTLINLGNSKKAEVILRNAIPVLAAEGAGYDDEKIIARTYLADAYRMQGRIHDAIEEYRSIRKSGLQNMPRGNELNRHILNNLAILYREAGNYQDALSIYEQLCDPNVNMKLLDQEEILVYANLSMTYLAMGRIQQALDLAEKVDAFFSDKLGLTHIDTLTSKNNLAGIYTATGKYGKALQIMKEMVEVQEKKFGKTGYNTLICKNNLAGIYDEIGQSDKSFPLFQDICKTYETTYSEDHPERMRALSNLGVAFYNSRRYPEAISNLTKVGELQKRKLGEQHPDTLATLSSLARALRASGKVPQAIELFESVLEMQTRILGENHTNTLQTINNLAEAYRNAGQPAKTLKLLEKAVSAQVNNFGSSHPDTLTIQGNLSSAYRYAGRLHEAVELIEKTALELERQRYQHRFAKNILQDAVEINEADNQFPKAEEWKRKLVQFIKKRDGESSPTYISELAGLALNLLYQKKWIDAEATAREALNFRQKKEPDAWTTFNTQVLLGAALLGQKKYADAEPLILTGYEGMKQREAKIPQLVKVRISEALDRLIQLYTESNNPDEAKKWQAEKEKLQKLAPVKK
ncbi:MAG: serine/threonine protein kinase [Planctomycetia bacterium]|nr:serine/threonine protein kinase [Planctomycetia bacterium]